jgi:hypothetical protein
MRLFFFSDEVVAGVMAGSQPGVRVFRVKFETGLPACWGFKCAGSKERTGA